MSSEKKSSCHECNYDEGTNLLKYDQSIYYLCDDCYEEHMKEEEIEKYGDVNQGLGSWNGYEYVKTNGGQ